MPRLCPATIDRTARSPNARRRACHRRRTRSRAGAPEIPPGNVGDDPSILAPVQPPHAVTMTAGLPPSEITLVLRISLALSGLMVSLPFLNFHHSLPLPTFYTEWLAFAFGTAAILALALAPTGKETRVPLLSLGLIGLTLVLLIQVAAGT